MSEYLPQIEKASPVLLALEASDIFLMEAEKHRRAGNTVEEKRHIEKARIALVQMIEAVTSA
jgi:hypothetical protein